MNQIDAYARPYDPRDHRTDGAAIFWGFVLLCAILGVLVLV